MLRARNTMDKKKFLILFSCVASVVDYIFLNMIISLVVWLRVTRTDIVFPVCVCVCVCVCVSSFNCLTFNI